MELSPCGGGYSRLWCCVIRPCEVGAGQHGGWHFVWLSNHGGETVGQFVVFAGVVWADSDHV